MIPFYCIDGPLKGLIIDGDFRQQEIEGAVYRKSTYGQIATRFGHEYRAWCDVAHVAQHAPRECPPGALKNLRIESEEGAPALHVTAESLGIVLDDGTITGTIAYPLDEAKA